jgi:hypothetical protein
MEGIGKVIQRVFTKPKYEAALNGCFSNILLNY